MFMECIKRTWIIWWTTHLCNLCICFQWFWTWSIVIGFERACEPKHQITMDHVQNNWNQIHTLLKGVVHQTVQVLIIHSINMVSISKYTSNIQTIYQHETYSNQIILYTYAFRNLQTRNTCTLNLLGLPNKANSVYIVCQTSNLQSNHVVKQG